MVIFDNTLITKDRKALNFSGLRRRVLASTGSSVDVSTEAMTECLASLLRQQGLKTSGNVFWSGFNIFGFVLSLVWIQKLESGSNLEEGENLSISMDSVSRQWVTSAINL